MTRSIWPRLLRMDQSVEVRVRSAAQEAAGDLVHVRDDQMRCRHRLLAELLLRLYIVYFGRQSADGAP